MPEPTKNQIIASSSVWVSVLLNFLPGLGTGYLYQRRWKAYWITNVTAGIWVYIDFLRQMSIDPSDPASTPGRNVGLLGLIIISSISAIEAVITINKEREKGS